MKRPIGLFAIFSIALALAGCAASGHSRLSNGYQPGDATLSILDAQASYCATADPYQRAVTLAVLHQLQAPIPDRGVCAGLLSVLPEIPAAKDLDVDIEAAREDQRHFGGLDDADLYPNAP